MTTFFDIFYHGAINKVTGSCSDLRLTDGSSMLVGCGLFQGTETPGTGPRANVVILK